MPLFSVIVTSLGRLTLLQHALSSVMKQDSGDFELILVNSHPSKEGENLVASFSDTRIRYITTTPSEAHLNWDVGYRAARGTYILWLDDDNYLLPHALSHLAAGIAAHAPDIATGDHLHWYEAEHPRIDVRNRIVIPLPLFSHAVSMIDGKNYIRSLFGMPAIGSPSGARFHFSETAIKREMIEASMPTIGRIDFRGTSPRMMQLILLARTEHIVHINSPLCIVIQMGDSIAYRWGKSAARAKRSPPSFVYSPVSADTYINTVTESLLATQQRFPDDLAPYALNWSSFFSAYARELMLLDQEWRTMHASWRELTHAMREKGVPVERGFCILNLLKSYCIKILRIVHVYQHARYMYGIRKRQSSSKTTKTLTMPDSVQTIEDCAEALPMRIEEELGIPYASFVGTETH
ncbi:MAG: glycosyltransferase family A protein [Minisyncoccia bacterium]